MERLFKPLTELKRILARQLREQPGCHDCQLRAVCVHRPDHTGCNWSAEVDFPVVAMTMPCATCRMRGR